MPVPAQILAVSRPKNTIVEERHTDGPYRYAVRERTRSAISSGGNPSPRNGKVIGHIIGGTYVPKAAKTASDGPSFLSYGSAALVHSVSDDLFRDLLKVFPAKEACSVLSAAALRVMYPGITNGRLISRYRNSFISRFYPGCSLSKNSLTDLLDRIGQDTAKRKQFYALRLESVEENHHIAIDGMLKQDNSDVNSLSSFSFKGRVKGTKDISLIYAYDIEKCEPICAEVFPGRKTDAKNFATFISRTGLKKGVIVADKGFPVSAIEEHLKEKNELHYLSPIRRNDKRIENNQMYTYEVSLVGLDREIQFKKVKIEKTGRYLYSFRDINRALLEEKTWIRQEKDANDGTYDLSVYEKKKESFGTIVFVSDLDMTPLQAYRCYEERWLIEIVFNRYKNNLDLDITRVQSDNAVIGSEFINFLASVMTCRIIRKAEKADLFKRMSYDEMMDDLRDIQREVKGGLEKPHTGDGFWNNLTTAEVQLVEELGLSIPEEKPEPRKRGRPRKEPEIPARPKRPRGRPRKYPVEADKPKRPRGRPRKVEMEAE